MGQYQSELEELATDMTGTKYLIHNNYLITMQQITTKATAELARYMDQGLKSEKPSVSTNKIQGKGYNSREHCGVRRGLSQRSNRESPQGSDREANRRFYQEQRFNRGSRRGTNLGLQRSNTKIHHSSRNQNIRYCNLCKVNGHDNLLFCPKLPEYVPELSSPTGTKSIPEEICKVCLSTSGEFSWDFPCFHPFPRTYNDWTCKESNISIVLCNCKDDDYLEWKHQGPQEWLRRNLNPNIGLSNLYNAWIRFRHSKNNSVLINAVQVEENIQDTEANNTDSTVSDQTPTSVEVMLVNDLPIRRACSPFEILRIQTKTGCHPVVLIYDTGAQVSLCNPETSPLLIGTNQPDKNLTISTIESANSKQRGIHTLDLGGGQQMDVILIPTLQLKLKTIKTPEVWQHTYDAFADQNHDNVKAQILVGADRPTLFPIAEMDDNGTPIETNKCRLMRSRITNRLILFGAHEDDQDDQGPTDSHGKSSIVQASVASSDIGKPAMSISAIPDVEPTDQGTNSR